MPDGNEFRDDFKKRFKKYNNRNCIDSDNGILFAKYDNECLEIYKEVILWNREWSGREYRLSFKSELNGFLYPTTNCSVFLRKNDPDYKPQN